MPRRITAQLVHHRRATQTMQLVCGSLAREFRGNVSWLLLYRHRALFCGMRRSDILLFLGLVLEEIVAHSNSAQGRRGNGNANAGLGAGAQPAALIGSNACGGGGGGGCCGARGVDCSNEGRGTRCCETWRSWTRCSWTWGSGTSCRTWARVICDIKGLADSNWARLSIIEEIEEEQIWEWQVFVRYYSPVGRHFIRRGVFQYNTLAF